MTLVGFCFSIVITLQMMFYGCANGDTRCYCNEASCVRTAYMCKSTLGTCFTLLTQYGGTSGGIRSIHGCTEVLTELDRRACDDDVISDDVIKSKSSTADWPRLHCCRQDMCNYVDHASDMAAAKRQNTRIETAGYYGEANDRWPPYSDDVIVSTTLTTSQQQQRDMWFRVAVIAVPLIGGFILICLVVIATRMLSADRQRRRHHHHHYHHHTCQCPLTYATPTTTRTTTTTTTNQLLLSTKLTSAWDRSPIGQPTTRVDIMKCNRTPPLTAAHTLCVEPCCCTCACKCKQINRITCIFGQDYDTISSRGGGGKGRKEGEGWEEELCIDKKGLDTLCQVHCSKCTTSLYGFENAV